jgi:hypothetical protein
MRFSFGVLAVGLVPLLCCGGGGDTGPSPAAIVTTTTTTSTTTTTTPTTLPARPVHAVVGNYQQRGPSPFAVAFVMCDSTDSAGIAGDASSLQYFADFDDGDGPVEQENCRFSHTFLSDGVDRLGLTFCVVDRRTRAQDCFDGPLEVAAGVRVHVDGSNDLACRGILRASASLDPPASEEVHATAAFDRVQFVARSGDVTRTLDGEPLGNGEWTTGDWNVGFITTVHVTARPLAGELEGYTGDGTRPACH